MLGDNATVFGVETTGNLHSDGSLTVGRFGTMYWIKASEGTKHNILFGTGSKIFNSEVHNIYFAGQPANPLEGYENVPNGEGLDIEDTWVHNDSVVAGSTCLYAHDQNGTHNFGTITVKNVRVDNCDGGIAPIAYTTLNITGGSSNGTNNPIKFWSGGSANLSSFTITNGGLRGIQATGGTNTVTNTVVQMVPGGSRYAVYSVANSQSFTITNSSLDADWGLNFPGTGNTIVSNGNAIKMGAAYTYYLGTGSSFTGDNNTYSLAFSSRFNNVDVAGGFAGWKTATGQDAHSTSAAP